MYTCLTVIPELLLQISKQVSKNIFVIVILQWKQATLYDNKTILYSLRTHICNIIQIKNINPKDRSFSYTTVKQHNSSTNPSKEEITLAIIIGICDPSKEERTLAIIIGIFDPSKEETTLTIIIGICDPSKEERTLAISIGIYDLSKEETTLAIIIGICNLSNHQRLLRLNMLISHGIPVAQLCLFVFQVEYNESTQQYCIQILT